MKRLLCLFVCLALALSATGCSEGKLTEKALEALSENEAIQNWLANTDLSSVSAEAIEKFKNSIPALKDFLAREDVQEKFETVGLPLIREFLSYNLESMRLKAETLGKIIAIFAPELTEQVDEIFATAPQE